MADGAITGRQRELQHVEAALARVTAGRLSVLLFAGEPGIGKSRLLDETGERARAAGWTVLRGGASEAEGMPPYLPILEALGRYIRRADAELLRGQVGPGGAILTAILPQLAWRLGDLSPAPALPPEQARLRLFDALESLLAGIAAPVPMLLVLDDLQWADAATLDLLCYIVRSAPDMRLLIAGAYREGDAADNAALERALAELVRLRAATTIAVRPLDTEAIAELAVAAVGGPIEPTLAALIATRGEGNPFFSEELIRGWTESGAIALEGELWRLASGATLSLPPTLAAAIRLRLARLPAEVVDLLRTAAVVGRVFEVDVVAGAAMADPEVVEDRLRLAVRARLVREDAPGRFSFGHDRIREALYAEITSTARTRLHAAVGDAIEHLGERDVRWPADLAFHFARAGTTGAVRAVQYAEEAARAALDAFAGEEAAEQFRVALSLSDDGHSRRGPLHRGMGEALLATARYDAAAVAFAAAGAWHERQEQRDDAARSFADAGRAWWRAEEHPPALAAFDRALELYGDHRQVERCGVLVDRAGLLGLGMVRLDDGMACAENALALARSLEDRQLEARAVRIAGNLRLRRGDMEAGIGLVDEALATAEGMGDFTEAAECCAVLAVAHSWQGAIHQTRAFTLRRLEHAQRTRDPFEFRHIHSWLAQCATMLGEFDEARQHLEDARRQVERLDSPEPRCFYLASSAMLLAELGDDATAAAQLGEACAILRGLAEGADVWFLGPLGLLYARLGRHAEAQALMAPLEATISGFPPGAMQVMEGATGLAELAILYNDAGLAARLLPYIKPFDGYMPWMTTTYTLAGLSLLLDDVAGAQFYLDKGEANARRQGLRPELGRTLVRRAAYERRYGLPRPDRLEREALALFEALGMPREAAAVRAALSPTARPSLPAGLSEREVEVLRLVAVGQSNRRIAETLYLSEKTVANHLTNIFTKTGSDNRAAAAAFAIRHGLL